MFVYVNSQVYICIYVIQCFLTEDFDWIISMLNQNQVHVLRTRLLREFFLSLHLLRLINGQAEERIMNKTRPWLAFTNTCKVDFLFLKCSR